MDDRGAFKEWARQTRGLSVVACVSSLVGSLVVAVAIGLAHSATKQGEVQQVTLTFLGIRYVAPDYAVSLVVSVTVLLTLAALVHSALARIDAGLIRRHLHAAIRRGQGGRPTAVVLERNLLASWTNELSSVVQLLVLSAALAYIGGWAEAFGMLIGLSVVVLVGVRFWGRALAASVAFLEARDLNRAARRVALTNGGDGGVAETEAGLVAAIFQRDTKALRLPALDTVLLSASLVLCAVIPMVSVPGSPSFVLAIVILLVWRQRGLDVVEGVGRLAWLVSSWSHYRATGEQNVDSDLDAD